MTPLNFNFWPIDSQLTEAFPSVTGASTPITPGKQRLGLYLRGVCGLDLLAPDLKTRGRSRLKGWHGGAAKHSDGVRSSGGRGGGGRGLGRWSLAVRERSSTVTGGR